MYKTLFLLLMLFLTISLNGQNTVLLKNFNPKAKELKHQLNKTRDSLVLGCEQKILKVEIFNEDFEKTVILDQSDAKISISDLPIGEFIVEAKLEDKTILMEIVRYERDDTSSQNSLKDSKNASYDSAVMLDENMKPINGSSNIKIENMLSPNKQNAIDNNKKFFWVILNINDKTGSSKTMKLVDESLAKKLIKRNKLEANNSSGKTNELKVWEVYDSAKFLRAQLADPNYINSTSSDLFNVIPFYVTSSSTIAVNLK